VLVEDRCLISDSLKFVRARDGSNKGPSLDSSDSRNP
jgi:hypothetical protein